MVGYKEIQEQSTNKRLKFLLKDSVLYGGANAFAKLFSIFTVPILTRVFSREGFGIIDGIGIFAALFTPIILMGMNSAIARFFYETDDEEEKKQIISQGLLVQMILAVVICFFLYIASPKLLTWFFATPRYTPLFRIVILSIFFSVPVMFSQNLLKWTFSRARFLVISLGAGILTILLILLYVLVFKLGVAGVFLAHLSSNLFFAILGLFFTRKHLCFPRQLKYVRPMLKFGWPLMFVALIPALIPSVDRYFIINYISFEMLGIYAVALKIANILQLPVMGFQTAWGPFALAIYREKNSGETYNKIFLYYAILLTSMALIIVLLVKPLIIIFASGKYLSALKLVMPLVFAVVIDSLSWISGIGISLSKKTIFKTISYAITLVTSLAAIWLLIKPFGLMGVVYGILISKVVLTFSKTLFAYKLYPIRFNFKWGIPIVAGGFISALIIRSIDFLQWYIQMPIGFGIFIIFVSIMWKYFIIDEDKKRGLEILKSKLKVKKR